MRYQFDRFDIDTSQYQVFCDGAPVACEPKVFDVIAYLIEHRQRLISRDELFEQVWLGRAVSDTSLSNHIKSARKLLGDSAEHQQVIKTLRGRGYQWVMPVTALVTDESLAPHTPVTAVENQERNTLPLSKHTKKDPRALETITRRNMPTPSAWQQHLYHTVILCLFVSLAVVWINRPPTKQTEEIQRIAVLPFHNLNNGDEHDYLAIALADQLIGRLNRIEPLTVRATGSIRPYQNTRQSPGEIGDRLNVDGLVMGSYHVIDHQLQLSLELINVEDQEMRWRQEFTTQLDRSFELPPSLSQAIAKQLKLTPPSTSNNAADRVPDSPLAYEYYLRALAFSDTTVEAKLALAMLDKARELSPDFAPIHSELGRRSHFLALFDLEKDIHIEEAQQHYQSALSLEPLSFSALNGLATLYTETGKISEAVALSNQLLQQNPNNAQAHFTLGYSYRYAGFTQASVDAITTALKLEPNDRWSHNLAISYIALNAYSDALSALQVGQETPYSLGWMATIYLHQGKKDLALETLNRAIELQPGSFWKNDSIGFRAYLTGDIETGLKAAQKLEAAEVSDGEALFYWGCLYALLGDRASSLRMLTKAVDHGYFNGQHFRNERFLESIKNTPEFQSLLKRVDKLHQQFRHQHFSSE